MARSYYYGERTVAVERSISIGRKYQKIERFTVYLDGKMLFREDGRPRKFQSKDAALEAGKKAGGIA